MMMLVVVLVGLVVGCRAAGGMLGRANALVYVQLAAGGRQKGGR